MGRRKASLTKSFDNGVIVIRRDDVGTHLVAGLLHRAKFKTGASRQAAYLATEQWKHKPTAVDLIAIVCRQLGMME